MNKNIFRKNSLERVSSPEQLNEYIRVSNPGIWVILIAVTVLLVGICVWGVMGRLDTVLTTVAVVSDGTTVICVKEADISQVKVGMSVKVNGEECVIKDISPLPIEVSDSFDAYLLHLGSLEAGEWIYMVYADAVISDGVYTAEIVTESVSPISFVIN